MKSELLEMIRGELRTRLDRLAKAAQDAHAAATDPGSRAESKYDTRSLEASYLATGQARQVEEWAAALQIFEALSLPEFDAEEPVAAGALVEVEMAGESAWFLLAPAGFGGPAQYPDASARAIHVWHGPRVPPQVSSAQRIWLQVSRAPPIRPPPADTLRRGRARTRPYRDRRPGR